MHNFLNLIIISFLIYDIDFKINHLGFIALITQNKTSKADTKPGSLFRDELSTVPVLKIH